MSSLFVGLGSSSSEVKKAPSESRFESVGLLVNVRLTSVSSCSVSGKARGYFKRKFKSFRILLSLSDSNSEHVNESLLSLSDDESAGSKRAGSGNPVW